MESVDLTIIGGGVCGLATAYFYSKKFPKKEILLLEKNIYLGEEQSGRNSGVLHSGILNPQNSLKSELCFRGVQMLKSFAKSYNIPCQTVGKLTVATKKEELVKLEFYLKQAIANGAEDARIIDGKEIKLFEPNIEALAAVYTSSTGIIDSASYIKTLNNLVVNNGVIVLNETKVQNVTSSDNSFIINAKQKNEEIEFKSKLVINAAGLYGVEIAKMINPEFPYKIKPLRGEFMKFNKNKKPELFMTGLAVYPLPKIMPGKVLDQHGKPRFIAGTHLTPTLGLNSEISNIVHVGPLQKTINDKTSIEDFVKDIDFLPWLKSEDLEPDYVGVQIKMDGYNDFVIEKDKKHPNAVHILAESPGLSSSLAIGDYAVSLFNV